MPEQKESEQKIVGFDGLLYCLGLKVQLIFALSFQFRGIHS